MNETKHFRGEGGGAARIEQQNIYASPSSFLNVKKIMAGNFFHPTPPIMITFVPRSSHSLPLISHLREVV